MKRQTAAVGILAIAIIGMFTSIDSIAQIPGSERAALIALYDDTFGDNWTYNTGWKGNNNELDGFSEIGSEGSWRGITVVGDHVTKIRLYTNGLTPTNSPEPYRLNSGTWQQSDICGLTTMSWQGPYLSR